MKYDTVYNMIECCQRLNKEGFLYRIYPETGLINVQDSSGIIQSFYSTTGTICIHASNCSFDHRSWKASEQGIDAFVGYLKNPGKGKDGFLKKYKHI